MVPKRHADAIEGNGDARAHASTVYGESVAAAHEEDAVRVGKLRDGAKVAGLESVELCSLTGDVGEGGVHVFE